VDRAAAESSVARGSILTWNFRLLRKYRKLIVEDGRAQEANAVRYTDKGIARRP
jgi:hypothetical protein